MRVNWVGQSATAKSSNVSSLRLLNAYAEAEQTSQGKTAMALYGTPGLKLVNTLGGTGGMRALFRASNGRVFAVQGTTFYEVLDGGGSTSRGTLLTQAGPVSMDDNGQQLMLVDGPSGYAFTLATNKFARILDVDFLGANRVGFLDNFLIFNQPGTQIFQWTDLLSTDIDALSFASAEGAPDLLITLLIVRRDLWLFGATSTEVSFNTGDPAHLFARIEGAFLQQGCAAVHSPARVGDALCWLSANEQGQGMVVTAQNYVATPLSNFPVSTAIQSYTVINDAIGWGQQQDSHLFYWLTFPSAGHTWVLDLATGLWHERGSLDPITGLIGRHRANCYAFAFGQHLVGDYENGRIYALDSATYSDNGAPLVFEAVMPAFFDADGLHRIQQSYLQLDAETGIGLDAAAIPGSDPQVILQLSNDGGHTWGNELARSLGKIGDTNARVQWYRLGAGFDRRCRIRISDPVRRVILGAVTDMETLA